MKNKLKVGLFVTCLVDFFRPQIAFASIQLLENAGCDVSVPLLQTCCGQVTYNNGDRAQTKHIAKQVIQMFEAFDYVVLPSGSCAGMLRIHYPSLFEHDDEHTKQQVRALAAKTYELTAFLVDVLQIKSVQATYQKTVTYHDACSGLRELNIKDQPRTLLASMNELKLKDLHDSEVCCGFGGTFCVKYPAISNKMVSDKCEKVQATGAEVLLSGDLGCLLNMAGKLKRENAPQKIFHVAEVLAGMAEGKGIGE